MAPTTRCSRRVALLLAAAALGLAAAACSSGGTPPPSPPSPPPPAGAGDGPPPTPADVEATKRALDERSGRAPDAVVSWGVDPAVGLVVVGVDGPRTAEVDRFLSGLDPRTLRVETGTPPPRPLPGA